MRKGIFVLLLSLVATLMFGERSIEDIVLRFDKQLEKNNIQRVEVVISSIYFAGSKTHGSASEWIRGEIEKAATKTARIKIIRDNLKMIQLDVKTRGRLAKRKSKKTQGEKRYVISGKYIENKTKSAVSLTLNLEVIEGDKTELLASETAMIPSSYFFDYGLTLYPKNIEDVQRREKDYEEAKAMIEKDGFSLENTENMSSVEKKVDTERQASVEKQAIKIRARMLDKKGNVVETLKPGDVVKFLVALDKDAYIRIMGIDAEGNTFWLPIRDNFLRAYEVRTFPDDNRVDYQVVDGVFGAEHLFIYASTREDGLPSRSKDAKYYPSLITDTARSMVAVDSSEELINGVFKISYTVVP